MDSTISDEEIQQILYNCWENIACFAYEGYNTNGRGVAHVLHEPLAVYTIGKEKGRTTEKTGGI